MSLPATEESHLRELLAKADTSINEHDLQGSANILREANRLASQDERIKDRWQRLRELEQGDDALELLRKCLSEGEDAAHERALHALKQKQLTSSEAQDAVNLLLDSKIRPESLDILVATVLTHSFCARQVVAERLSNNATRIFELLFNCGEQGFGALASIPLEKPVWKSEELQKTAQEDVFRLSVAKLIDAGAENLDRVLKCLARLLSLAADTVTVLVDEDVMDAILPLLDIRLDQLTRSQAMLASSKLLEATKARGEELFSQFITARASQQTSDDLIVAFSAATALFPVIPGVASRLFLIDGFVQQLVPNLERNSEDGMAGKCKSRSLETAALELLSAACVEKSCREAIKRYCTHWLEELAGNTSLVNLGTSTHEALASLVLAKISAESSQDVTKKLKELVLSEKETDQAIEGLAYTSLQATIKEDIAGNSELLERLTTALRTRSGAVFGCLTIFANITGYTPVLTEEQEKMSQLKAYANQTKPTPSDPLNDDQHVSARCSRLLDANVVASMVEICRQTTSPTNVALIAQILLSLAREQRHRPAMAQQGAVKLLLQMRDRLSTANKAGPEASQIGRNAAHALARLLISINPAHIFSSAVSASSASSALMPLLAHDHDGEHRNLLPTFEALLALTNLSSLEDNSVRDLQIRLAWTELEDHLLLSSNTLVQRASVELVCNWMASPNCVAKFVGDGSKRESTRTRILLALTDVEDLATRSAAGGALAMLTEWDAAVAAILSQPDGKGVGALLAMCEDESDEVKHRGLVCVSNVIGAPGERGAQGLASVKEAEGAEVLRRALHNIKTKEIASICSDTLKKLG